MPIKRTTKPDSNTLCFPVEILVFQFNSFSAHREALCRTALMNNSTTKLSIHDISSAIYSYGYREVREKKQEEKRFKMALKSKTLTLLQLHHNKNMRKGLMK